MGTRTTVNQLTVLEMNCSTRTALVLCVLSAGNSMVKPHWAYPLGGDDYYFSITQHN